MTETTTRAAETWAHMLAEVDPMPVCVALDYAQEGFTFEDARDAVEAVAQAHLDAHPDDHSARRLLGEWLSECGDERGEGYRALGMCERMPKLWLGAGQWFWLSSGTEEATTPQELPADWFDELPRPHERGMAWPYGETNNTRAAAEDAAAKAFLRLPESRRAQLQKGCM